MQRAYPLAHLILAVVVTLVLTLLMVCVETHAQIAFMSHRDGNWEIYVMDTNGGNQRNLSKNGFDEWDPSWSPDGKWIAFVSDRNDRGWNRQIYVMDTNGGNQRRLTNNHHDDRSPSWSPDGKRIAFVSDRAGHVHDGWPTSEIYVMDNDGSNPQNLSNNPPSAVSPAWLDSPFSVSPAGKRFTMWGRLKQVDR